MDCATLLVMTRQTFIVMRIIFSMMVLGGAFAGFSSLTANGFDCGAVLRGQSSVDRATDNLDVALYGPGAGYNSAPCVDKRSSQSMATWGLILVGGIGNVIAFVMRPPKEPLQNELRSASKERRPTLEKSDPSNGSPTAGWYPDPNDDARLAYWDGDDWVDFSDPLSAGWYPDPDDEKWLAYWDGDDWVEMNERYPNR